MPLYARICPYTEETAASQYVSLYVFLHVLICPYMSLYVLIFFSYMHLRVLVHLNSMYV
jgi:hypothetical protein